MDGCPHCGADLEIEWRVANPDAPLGDQVDVPQSARCPNADQDERKRLHDLLARLEWSGWTDEYVDGYREVYAVCPACRAPEDQWPKSQPMHNPGCGLAEFLGR